MLYGVRPSVVCAPPVSCSNLLLQRLAIGGTTDSTVTPMTPPEREPARPISTPPFTRSSRPHASPSDQSADGSQGARFGLSRCPGGHLFKPGTVTSLPGHARLDWRSAPDLQQLHNAPPRPPGHLRSPLACASMFTLKSRLALGTLGEMTGLRSPHSPGVDQP